jgi:hypothetical protein
VGWLGGVIMAVGLGLDLIAHTILPSQVIGGFSPGQHAAHLVVLLGMVVVLGAVVVDGTRQAATRRQEGRTRDAHR